MPDMRKYPVGQLLEDFAAKVFDLEAFSASLWLTSP